MKKKLRKYIILPLLAVLWLCGCGKKVLGRYVAQRAKQSVGRAERLDVTADRRQGKVRFSFHQAIVTKKGKSRRENFPKIKIPNRMRKQYVEKRNFLTRLTGS